MISQNYQALSRRIYSNFPLIGWLLRRWTAKRLAKDGSGEAIAILAEAITCSQDKAVRDIAFSILKQLKSQDAIDAFCRVWVNTRHKDLTAILKNRRYIGTQSKLRVLSALKAGDLSLIKRSGIEILEPLLDSLNDSDIQIAKFGRVCIEELSDLSIKSASYFLLGEWEKYDALDADQKLLSKAYYDADDKIRKKIVSKSKSYGRIEWIKIIALTEEGFNVDQMSDESWGDFIDILLVQPDRRLIWQFLINAPAIWSKRLLEDLDNASCRWFEEDHEATVNALLTLAKKCKDNTFPFLLDAYIRENNCKFLEGNSESVKDLRLESILISKDSRLLFCQSDAIMGVWSIPEGNNVNNFVCTRRFMDRKKIDDNSKYLGLLITPSKRLEILDNDYSAVYPTTHYFNLRSLPNGNILKSLIEESYYASCVTISIDGKFLIWVQDVKNSKGWITSQLSMISLWNLNNGNHIQILSNRDYKDSPTTISTDIQNKSTEEEIEEVPVFPIRSRITGTIKVDMDNYFPSDSTHAIKSLAISPDNSLLASGDISGNIHLWNLPNGDLLKILVGHTKSVTHLVFSPNCKILASGSSDEKVVCLWQLPDGKHLKTLNEKMNIDGIETLEITPDNKILIVGTKFKSIHLWSLPDINYLRRLEQNVISNPKYPSIVDSSPVVISQDGKILATTSRTDILLFNLSDGEIIATFKGHKYEIRSLAISPDCQFLASNGVDGTLRLWKIPVPNNIPLKKLNKVDIDAIELKTQDTRNNNTGVNAHNALKFILALLNLKNEI